MKKFFNNGGTESSSPSPRTPVTANGAYSLHTVVPTAGYLAAPVAATSSPRTPLVTSQQQYFDIQRTGTISPAPSSTMMLGSGLLAPLQNIAFAAAALPASPGAISQLVDSSKSITNMQEHTIERNDMLKGLKSLEILLVTLNEYRDLKSKLAKSEKRLAKNLAELSKCKMLEDVPSQTLQSSALLIESITDTTSKHAKLIQKEYDSLNEHCEKYFKKIAKEERLHDELLETLDSKVKRANASHEKNSKKSGRMAIESHDRYIHTVQSLTQEISKAKASHNASVGNKTFITSLVVASTLGGIADCEFKALCENVRRAGPHVGKLNEWLNFASTEGMASVQPMDLGDDAMGWAQVLAIKEAEIRDEMMKQEQAKYAHLEHAQALLKAQQMGWTPPPAVQSRSPHENKMRATSNASLSNMPRLDSRGQVVDRPIVSRAVSIADSQQSSSAPTKTAAIKEDKLAVQDIAEEEKEQDDKPHSQQSSLADGTVIDRGEGATNDEPIKQSSPMKSTASRDSSDAMPSLSASGSTSKDSDDSEIMATRTISRSTGPPTPNDEMPPRDILIIKGVPERVEGILKKTEAVDEVEVKVERPAGRYVDVQVSKPLQQVSENVPVLQRSDSIEDRSRRLSLWEHERERERQVEREAELQKRLLQAEDRLRTMDKDGQAKVNSYRREDHRPRYSEPSRSYQATIRQDEEIPAQRYEPDRYAPSVGTSRLSSGGVNRTMSTDSERSFVARMKLKYQEDKGMAPSPRPAPLVHSGRHDSYKAYAAESLPSMSSRGRYDSAPSRGAAEEQQRSMHGAGCGCWSCSARHYSSPKSTTQPYQLQPSSPSAPPPSSRHPAQQHPPNHRRQTMPPLQSPPREAGAYSSRGFDVEADRRVMFANDYATVR